MKVHVYKVLCERMPDPFSAWEKLVKDRVSFFTEHYSAEICFNKAEGEFSEFKPVLVAFQEFCSVLFTQCPSVRIRAIKSLVNSWSTSRRLHEHSPSMFIFW